MYFQGIGASGFVLGAIRTAPPPAAADASLRYAMAIDGMRRCDRQTHPRGSQAIRPQSRQL